MRMRGGNSSTVAFFPIFRATGLPCVQRSVRGTPAQPGIVSPPNGGLMSGLPVGN